MISYITGKIIGHANQALTVLTNTGVGYEVRVTPVLFLELNKAKEVNLYTYLAVRENALELYGFKNLAERDLFMKFLNVSGVGPKSALYLLSLGSVEEISGAIARGDVSYLTKVSGVGKKTAERIVVDLKSKMVEVGANGKDAVGEQLGEVIDALVSLGYTKNEARQIVRSLDSENKTSEELLKIALKSFSK